MAEKPAESLTDEEKLLTIIHHPHPALRHKSKPIRRVDAQLKDFVAQMFDLMYEHRGVGLAANQVNLPLQLFIVNTAGKRGEGEELVFLNPVISRPKGADAAEEGCLSLPGVYGEVTRPAEVDFSAYDLSGNAVNFRASGYMARVLQHEFDHLQGTMFFDRMSPTLRTEIVDLIEEFEEDFQSRRETREAESDQDVKQRLDKFERLYC